MNEKAIETISILVNENRELKEENKSLHEYIINSQKHKLDLLHNYSDLLIMNSRYPDETPNSRYILVSDLEDILSRIRIIFESEIETIVKEGEKQ